MSDLSRTSAAATALVLFSGGQDSATCLAWALDRYSRVETIAFDYGQRHSVELTARHAVRDSIAATFPDWAERLGADHQLSLSALGEISETAMTRDIAISMDAEGLPNTFVPGRNLVFLVMAAALAVRRDAGVLVGGMCETDFSGYPDCRADTLEAQMHAINLGMAAALKLEVPLMHLTKAQSWMLAEKLGADALVDLIRVHSHSCYTGVRDTMHEWGFGCGTCPACELRKRGWDDYQSGRNANRGDA